jgi:hypothetical protein
MPDIPGDYAEVQMTAAQHNAVIEDKLTHLMPVLRDALASMERVNESLRNGGVSWRYAFQRAKKRIDVSDSV